MPHSRTASTGKNLKKTGGKKGVWSSMAPVEDAETGASAQPAQDDNTVDSTGDAKNRQRSKSQGTAAFAAQMLSQAPSGGESNTPARRRAATGQSVTGKNQNSAGVFHFLDEKREHDAAPQDKTSRLPKDPSRRTTKPASKERKRKTSMPQSFQSDSGISVRGQSPDDVSSVGSRDSAEYQPPTPPDVPLDAVNWKLAAGSRTRLPIPGTYLTDTETIADSPASRSVIDLSAPETYYCPRQLPAPDPAESTTTMRKSSRPKVDTNAIKPKDKSPHSASPPAPNDAPLMPPKADNNPRPRLYRQFGDLNHRLLCHLQDEVAQMEDDLSTLDELEKMHQSSSDSQASPRQKQLAAKFHDLHINDWSVLHDKRNELLEKLVVKTEQYSKWTILISKNLYGLNQSLLDRTLCAYNKSAKTLHSASDRGVGSYRAAAQGHMTKTDRRILAHETDLVFLDPRHSRNRPNPLYATVAAIFAAILLPLLAFGAITEFFGRIVVVAFTGAAIAFWASNGPPGNEYMIAPQDGWAYAAGYENFLFPAALMALTSFVANLLIIC